MTDRWVRAALEKVRWSMSLLMALWFFAPLPCWAADPVVAASAEPDAALPDAPLPQADAAQSQALEITILDGDGALNNIRQRTAREPIVQVRDRNRKPVAGALILFTVNNGSNGAGATIGSSATFSTVTDANGIAQARGLKPNSVVGNFTITVTATAGATFATAIVHQENRLDVTGEKPGTATTPARTGFHLIPRTPLGKGIFVGGIIGVGVVVTVTVVLATRSGGTNIAPGTGTVGAPLFATHPGHQ